MNEKDLGDALLKWDSRGQMPEVDPQKLVARVLAQDRRRAGAGWRVRRSSCGLFRQWEFRRLPAFWLCTFGRHTMH